MEIFIEVLLCYWPVCNDSLIEWMFCWCTWAILLKLLIACVQVNLYWWCCLLMCRG